MKYLAIDLGNVVCEVNFSSFIRELSRYTNASLDDVDYFLRKKTSQHLDLGLTSISAELKQSFNIKSPVILDDLVKEWNNSITRNIAMIDLLRNLIETKSAEIALLSNIGYEHAELMENMLSPLVYNSSVRFFSCEIGARKPGLLYYKTFLDMYPQFRGCTYIDDRPENLIAGEKFGFQAVHFALDQIDYSDIYNRVAELKTLILQGSK